MVAKCRTPENLFRGTGRIGRRNVSFLAAPGLAVAMVAACTAASARAKQVALRIHNPSGITCERYPFTVGVPFGRGALKADALVKLSYADGKPIPVQTLVTATWEKERSSAKWLLLDFVAPVKPGGATLRLEPAAAAVSPRQNNVASETAQSIFLYTGRLKLEISKKNFNLFHQVWADLNGDGRYEPAEALLDTNAERGPYIRNQRGTLFWAHRARGVVVKIEENGPIKAVVMAKGTYTSAKLGRFCQFIVRITAHRGMTWVRSDHTFVYTADSDKVRLITDLGCRLPLREPARRYRFGVVRGDVPLEGACATETISLYQRDHNRFQLNLYQGPKKLGLVKSGRRGSGRVSVLTDNARITAGVEDFWQQFPKELSVDGRGLTVHFWPAHGQKNPRWKLPANAFEKLNDTEATKWLYPLRWVHEGAALSFKMPPAVAKFADRRSGDFRYVKKGRSANGMGIAKTHRVFFEFVPKASAPAACPLNVAKQPYAHPDPDQVFASRAVGALWPRDPKRFPAAERVLASLGGWMASLPHKLNDYGMWHWVCGHQYLEAYRKLVRLPRAWVNTHDGRPRWPWVLFLRSGDPVFRAAALRMTRHCADIAICHYTTPEYNKGRHYASNRKFVGGTCDYKGLVPWHAGDRFTYNSGVDWYLWNYYATGDRRSWDVAMEHGNYVQSCGGRQNEREGSARIATMIAMYHATWEKRFLDKAIPALNASCKSIEEAKKSYGSIQYHPHWERTLDTPDLGEALLDRVRKAVILRAEDELTYGFHNSSSRFSHHKVMGLAYRLTKDPRYLAWGDAMTQSLDWARYRGKEDLFQGYVAWAMNLGTLSYYLQRIPYHLSARASHKGPVPDYAPPFTMSIRSEPGHEAGLIVRKDRPSSGGTTRVRLKANIRSAAAKAGYVFVVRDGQGREVHSQAIAPVKEGRQWSAYTLGFDFPNRLPPGEYFIHLRKSDGKGAAMSLYLPLPKAFPFKKVVFCVPEMGLDQKLTIGRGLLYFFVPESAKKVVFVHRSERSLGVLLIQRPDGDGWTHAEQMQKQGWPGWRMVTAKVQPAHAGKVWRLFSASGTGRGNSHLWLRKPPNAPLVLADRPERFFVPEARLPKPAPKRRRK